MKTIILKMLTGIVAMALLSCFVTLASKYDLWHDIASMVALLGIVVLGFLLSYALGDIVWDVVRDVKDIISRSVSKSYGKDR